MRRLIAAMKVSVDANYEGPEGYADWVPAWSDDFGLTSQIDACVLGGKMYAGYEPYWTGIASDPTKVAWINDAPPTQAEIAWAQFARQTPHYVVSKSLKSAAWANTHILRGIDEIAALKDRPGKDIYLMGGAQLVSTCIDAGIVDELRLLVYPVIAVGGKPLFATLRQRQPLVLRSVEQRSGGLLFAVYDMHGDNR